MNNKIQILLIDDDIHNQQIVKDTLQKDQDKFEIIEADNLFELEQHLNKSDFDLVVSDLNILGFEDLDLLKKIKEKKPNTPVIIVSGNGSIEVAVEAMKLGASDYVIKSEKHIQNLTPIIRKVIENMQDIGGNQRTRTIIRDISKHKKFEEHLLENEKLYRDLFESLLNGLAYCRMLFDRGIPNDFIYLKVNNTFESLTGLKDVVGKRASEVIPGIQKSDPKIFEIYGRVALTGKSEKFEIHLGSLNLWFLISVYSPQREYFVAVFDDITQRKLSEETILKERTRSEEILHISEEKFRKVFEYSIVGKCITTVDGKIKTNKAYRDILGYSEEELLNIKWEEITHKDDIEIEIKNTHSLVCGELKTINWEKRYIHKNGSIVWVDICTSMQRDDNGNPLYFLTTIINITEKKLAFEAIKATEIRYRRLFESSKDGILILDAETGIVVDVNPFLIELLGYSIDQFHGKRIWEIGVLSGLIANKEKFLKLQQNEYVRYEDLAFKTIDGRNINVEFASNVYEVNQHKVIQCNIRDITERKKAEEQRIVQTTALEATANSIVITDAEGTITWVNNAFAMMTGYSKEEVIGKNPRILKSGKHDESFYKNMWNTVMAGNVWHGEIINKRKDNTLLNDEMTITPVLDTNGIVRNFIAIKQDITERKRSEDEIRNLNVNLELKVEERTKKLSELNKSLNELKAQAEHANQAKSEFLANISHEIRTPMNAVLGYAELLNNLLADKTQKDYLNSIMSSGKNLMTLINDILDLSKIEAGKMELIFDYVNTRSFFQEFENIFAWKVEEKGLTFILDIALGIPEGIFVDELRLRQIILNIIGNAIKFTQKGHIKLKVSIENPQIVKLTNQKTQEYIDLVIEVEDTGIGISSEFQEHIFEPFAQEQHKNQFGGTGLGLAITLRLLSLMNGTIRLKSKLNKGSTFQLKIHDIAYIRDFERKTYNVQIDPANINFGKATILIVDDIAHNRRYFVDALKNTNIEIIEAEDGLIGYNLARERLPDLIITDLRMPNLDGFGLLKEIKDNSKLSHIPVIAYSASVMKEQKEKVFNCNFSGFLIKPVSITELYLELMNFLPHTRNNVENYYPHKKELFNQIVDIQGLVQFLETIYSDRLKKFEVRQPLDEVMEFGESLENLGNSHNAEIIKEYGNELRIAAEKFNIDSILKLLNKYQGIVKEIKEHQSTI